MYGVIEFLIYLPQTLHLPELEYNKIFLLALVFILSAFYLWTNNSKGFPPGPRGYPLLGNVQLLQNKPHLRLTNLKDKYGDIFSLKLGSHRAVVVCSFEGILGGLVKESPNFSGRPQMFSSCVLYNGQSDGGVCFSDLSLKYKMKKDFILHGLDHLCCGNSLECMISNEAERIVFYLLSQNSPCDVSEVLESSMLRIMLYVVNGKLYEANDDNFIEIWRTFRLRHEVCCNNSWSSFVPLLQRLHQHHDLEVWERTRLQFEYQRSIINRHKDCFNPDIVNDMIDHMLVMLEKNEDMGLLDQDDLDSMFVEISGSGFYRVATTLRWLILYITSFPDVQKKVQEELLSVVGKERLPKMTDQPYLPYTCAVVMETHRLATISPFLYPHSTREDTEFMGYKIPKDTMVLFNIWSLHHDPKLWKHPMKFDPTRFLQEDGSLHIPDYFLPFGEGLRVCPGESLADIELFIFTTHLLYQLTITLHASVDLEGEYKGYMVTPKPFKVTVAPREAVGEVTELASPSNTVVCIEADTHLLT